MKVLDCLIVEDSPEFAEAFSIQLSRLMLTQITICNTFDEASEAIRQNRFDLIFLDIKLGDRLGLDLLKIFPTLPPVIILSSYSQYALESFDLDVVADYVMKPSTDIRLLKAINRALTDVQYFENSIRETNFAYLKVGRRIERFLYDSIDHVEAYAAYSKIIQGKTVTLVNEPISNVAQILPTKQFVRVHKSHIININKITSFDHKYFFINDTKIPIGISYKPQLESLFRLFSI